MAVPRQEVQLQEGQAGAGRAAAALPQRLQGFEVCLCGVFMWCVLVHMCMCMIADAFKLVFLSIQ